LEYAADFGVGDDLEEALKKAYSQLGAPGDFGYGTPCGDSLEALYDEWAKTVKQRKAAAASLSGTGAAG